MIKLYVIFVLTVYVHCGVCTNFNVINHYSVTKGLKSDKNVRVLQDKQGFYWFGTSKGLQRFDGYEFKEFPIVSYFSQPPVSFEVYKLFLTADSSLLVGTSIGLLQFDELHNQFNHIAFGREHSAYRVIDICQVDDSTYFVNSFRMKGVCVYHANRMVVEPAESVDTLAMNNPKVSMFVKGTGTNYFVRIANDIYEYDLATDCHVACKREAIPSDVNFHYGFTDKLGVFWLLTEAGLYCKPLNKPFERFKTIDTYCALDKQIGSSIIPATDSSLFVAFDWWGVVEISIKTKRVISVHRKTENQLTKLPSNQIYSLFVARDGELWWCNEGAYLLKKDLGDRRFIESDQTIETKNFSVLDILQDSQNRIWVATDGGGLHQYLLAENKTIPASKLVGQNLPDAKVILSLHEDAINHDLWIGTYGDGLYRHSFTTKSSEHFKASKSNGIKRNVINAIGQDRVGDILVSSLCQSLSIYDHKTKLWSNLTEAEGALRDNCVMKIARDSNNMLWLGYAEQGFDAYYEAVNKKMLGVARMINESVLAFGFEGKTVWIGGNQGLSAFDRYSHSLVKHPICKAFTNCKVYDLYTDSKHRVWVASSNGLFYFTASDTIPQFSNLNTFFKNSIPKRIIETHDLHLLIGGTNGLLSVPTTSAANNNELAFSLHLTDVRLFGKSLALTNKNGEAIATDKAEVIEFDYNSNSLGLSFSTLNIALNDIIGYQVKVDNLYSQWQAIEPNVNHFELPNLQPGTYVVHIRAFLKTNSSIYKEKRFTIVIVPPLWQRFWFRLLVSLLVVALVTAYIYVRYLNLKREQAKLEHLVAQRTESLRLALEAINESKVVIEVKNQELQETLQMKDKLIGVLGHDFKNPLAAIQGLLEITKLQLKVISPEKLERFVDALIDSTQRLSEQMITVFDWAQGHQQKMNYHPVDINPETLLLDVISLVKQNAIQKNISITTQIAYTHNVMVDVRMVHTVFRNLLTNAIKFTPKNASIAVLLNEDDSMIEFAFIDSGVGMDTEQLRNMFDNTQTYSTRGTNNETGSGFGLQVCKQFIEQNNGTFSINNVSSTKKKQQKM